MREWGLFGVWVAVLAGALLLPHLAARMASRCNQACSCTRCEQGCECGKRGPCSGTCACIAADREEEQGEEGGCCR